MPARGSPRKRRASLGEDDSQQSSVSSKRQCADNDGHDGLGESQSFVDAVMTPSVACEKVMVTADVHQDDETLSQLLRDDDATCNTSHVEPLRNIMSMISKLSVDLHLKFEEVNSSMERMAKDIEAKLSNKFSQMLDKRVTAETNKMRKDVQKEMDSVKDDLREDIKCLQAQIDSVGEKIIDTQSKSAIDENVIIRNLPESEGENLNTKVKALLRDGLKLRNMEFTRAERKESRRRGKAGVVVMTCRSEADKRTVMTNKKLLKDSRQYRDVFIHSDQSPEARLQTNNMKTLLSSLKEQVPGLRWQGSRLVRERPGDRANDGPRRDVAEGRSDWRASQRDGNRGNNSYRRPYHSDRGPWNAGRK